ncbi:unnamed protein product, partial [Hapterophycus canaliculatus]
YLCCCRVVVCGWRLCTSAWVGAPDAGQQLSERATSAQLCSLPTSLCLVGFFRCQCPREISLNLALSEGCIIVGPCCCLCCRSRVGVFVSYFPRPRGTGGVSCLLGNP